MTLDGLRPGQTGIIKRLDPNHPSLIRLAEMGMINGQSVTLIRRAPLGEPIKVRVMNYDLCIRKSEARAIHVDLIEEVVNA